MRLAEGECIRISRLCKPVNLRASRVGKTEDFRRLVKRLTRRIVQSSAHDNHIIGTVNLDNLRMASRYKQAQKREMGLFHPFAFNEMGKDMPMQMVNLQ